MVLFALGGVALSTWGPRLPSVRSSLGVGDAVIGLALAGVTVGSMAGVAVSARVLARFGVKRAIGAAVVLIAVGIGVLAVGAGLMGAVAPTVVGFVVVGVGVGAFDVMINVQGSALEQAAGKTLMPLLHASWSAGAVVGSAIAAGAAAARVDFWWQFLAEAILIAAVGFGVLPALRDSPGTPAEHGVAGAPAPSASSWWRRAGRSARRLLDARLMLIGVVMLGAELGEGTANSWLTLSASDGHGQSEAVAALFFTVFAVAETSARVVGGPVVDRIGRVRTIRLTTLVGVVGLVLFILGGSTWLILIGVVLWAVGISMGFPLGMSAAADSGPNPAARVSAVASLGYLANLAGPPVIGALSGAVGLLDSFWVVVVLLGVAFAVAGAFAQHPREPGTGPSPTAETDSTASGSRDTGTSSSVR